MEQCCGRLLVFWRNGPIFWRIVFLALETALEDAMVTVAIDSHAMPAGCAIAGAMCRLATCDATLALHAAPRARWR